MVEPSAESVNWSAGVSSQGFESSECATRVLRLVDGITVVADGCRVTVTLTLFQPWVCAPARRVSVDRRRPVVSILTVSGAGIAGEAVEVESPVLVIVSAVVGVIGRGGRHELVRSYRARWTSRQAILCRLHASGRRCRRQSG